MYVCVCVRVYVRVCSDSEHLYNINTNIRELTFFLARLYTLPDVIEMDKTIGEQTEKRGKKRFSFSPEPNDT